MRRRSFLFVLPMIAALGLIGCESSTDIQDLSATGRWDGVGALQQVYPGLLLELSEQSDGQVSGCWRFRGTACQNVSGVNSAGSLDLTLASFPTGTAQFEGEFTHDFRMEGTLNGAQLNGSAVFRRTSYEPYRP